VSIHFAAEELAAHRKAASQELAGRGLDAVIESLRPLLIASLISLGVMLVAYMLRKAFGPPQRDPAEVIRESETRRESETTS
jgi:hypothetical protein